MDLLPPFGWCAAGLDVVLEVVLPATDPVGLRVGLHGEADRGAVVGGVERAGRWRPPRPFERAEDAVVLGQDEDPAGVQQDGRRSTGRTRVARSHNVHPCARASVLALSPVPPRQPRQTRTHFDLDTTVRRCSRRARRLIASIHAALDDEELMQFQTDLIDQVGIHRARGIVIDVAALDVLGSFASKSLHDLAYMARLRRAETVIVGIQPEVAFALVQLPGRSRCTPR